LPRRERFRDRRLEVRRRHAGQRALGVDVVARRLRPLHRHRLAVHRLAEVQVRKRRLRLHERQQQGDQALHRAPASARTRVSNSSSAIGMGDRSPRTIRTGPDADGHIAGDVTTQPVSRVSSSRYTPWLKPTRCGIAGPLAPRKTTTWSSTANSGAPTNTLRKRPRRPPGTRNCTAAPRLPFTYRSTSSVTSVSIAR